MTVLLYPNPLKDTDLSVTRRAAALLHSYGVRVLLPDDLGPDAVCPESERMPVEQALSAADQVVTIGGDGTLLRAASQCLKHDKPLLGINLGRMGFLATCEMDEMPHKLKRLAQGDCHFECRSLLQVEKTDGAWSAAALNDVVLYGKSRMHPMDYTIYCDGVFVCRYRSDGIIAATPTGSTAYSLSAGGPILDASASVFVLNAICPHSPRQIPMVFSHTRRVTVVSEAANRDKVLASADSRVSCELEPGDRVDIFVAKTQLRLAAFDEAEQFRAIETKLMRR